jgi:hypothetical protein
MQVLESIKYGVRYMRSEARTRMYFHISTFSLLDSEPTRVRQHPQYPRAPAYPLHKLRIWYGF